MPVLYVRLTIILALSLGVIGLAASSEWETTGAVHAGPPIRWVCPPCGEPLPTTTELVWLHGKRWALCGPECQELLSKDALPYAGMAID